MRIRRFPFRILFSWVQSSDHRSRKACIVVRTLIIARFVAISRGTLIWHLARMGFNLFTLIVKFNIRDNAHPLSRSWNSSSNARVGSMTCCSYHAQIGVSDYLAVLCNYALISTFILRCEFTVEFTAVFTFTPRLSIASLTRSRITLPVSSKNRCGSMWLEFITKLVNILGVQLCFRRFFPKFEALL